MSVVTSSIYSYVDEKFIEISHKESDTCEDVCTLLCKKFGIGPLVQLLLGLRIHDTKYFLPGCHPLNPSQKHEFRVRFKIPKLSNLKSLDKSLFNYYYYQLRHDLLQSKISEIEYAKHKNKILGYVVSDMYRKMVEDKCSVGELEKNYKHYMPRKINEKHSILFINYARSKVFSLLNKIKNTNHDVDYVKSVYIDDIDNIAPGYLYEEYTGSIAYPPEDNLKTGKCRVKIKFVPFCDVPVRNASSPGKGGGGEDDDKDDYKNDDKIPGLKVFYSHKWMHVAKIDEIFTILKEKDKSVVEISIKDQPNHYKIDFADQLELDSFVSCLSGYYRLMFKWTQNVCKDLNSPSLTRLLEIKCHGPIGGKFSYNKIAEKNSTVGAHIVRQCELHHDTYYVDILEKGHQPITYKVTYELGRWHLHKGDEKTGYDELKHVIKNLNPDIAKQQYRLSPSEYDKPPNLLLCAPAHQLTSKKILSDLNELKQIKPQIINAAKDLILNRNALKDCGDGYFEKTRAELQMPNNTKIDVTLKMLKSDKKNIYLCDFLQLTDFWASLDSIDIIKLYGITLFKPIAMVLESSKDGPLDEFLRRVNNVPLYCLIDAAHSLARALYYLQEQNLTHGRLRCSAMQVVHYNPSKNLLVSKLGDAGFPKSFTKNDIPWIPIEYHELKPYQIEKIKKDPKAEIWACATTFWEIFSRGKRIRLENPRQFFLNGERLCPPPECDQIREVYEIMHLGWHEDPDKRFSPQVSLSTFMSAKQKCSNPYNEIYTNHNENSTIGSGSKHSIFSNNTENTFLNSRGDLGSYVSSDCEQMSNSSNCSTLSDVSCTPSSAPLLHYNGSVSQNSGSTIQASITTSQIDEYLNDDNLGYIELPQGKIIFSGEIGEGHYGKVYRGQIDDNESIKEVALKTIKTMNSDLDTRKAIKDFQREINIMKKLNHPNIVKIVDYIDEPQKRLIIIMEYVKHGSLLDYLKYNRHSITTQHLLKFAKDIASGMAYLCSKNIIHRDLAARNILVDSNNLVKISDFGLAQFTNSGNYYIAESRRDLPLKWYAPETIKTQKYSFQSDVWSFGVTLFEMFSYGEPPYNGEDFQGGDMLYDRLENGERLSRPADCDQLIYDDLMWRCWNFDPHIRPTFDRLLTIIDGLSGHFGKCPRKE